MFLSPAARWSHSFFHHYDEDSKWAILSTYIVFDATQISFTIEGEYRRDTIAKILSYLASAQTLSARAQLYKVSTKD